MIEMPASCNAFTMRSRRSTSTESRCHSTRWEPAENGGWCIMTSTGPRCSLTRATSQVNCSSEYLTCTSRVQRASGIDDRVRIQRDESHPPVGGVEAVVEPVAADRQTGRDPPVLDPELGVGALVVPGDRESRAPAT